MCWNSLCGIVCESDWEAEWVWVRSEYVEYHSIKYIYIYIYIYIYVCVCVCVCVCVYVDLYVDVHFVIFFRKIPGVCFLIYTTTEKTTLKVLFVNNVGSFSIC